MAFNYSQGLTPTEIAFICEMELVTVVPRQKLERLDLVGGPVNPLVPPQRASIPLWLAVLLKRQKRANIVPPPWLHPDSLHDILELETDHFPDSFSPAPPPPKTPSSASFRQRFYPSPPFLTSSTATASVEALPYHWLEVGQILLDGAAEDLVEPDKVRQLMRDLREVRAAKMRKGIEVLTGDGQGVRLDGVGAMEIGQNRSFIIGVVDGLRKLGASREQAQKDRAAADGDNDDGIDDDMEL